MRRRPAPSSLGYATGSNRAWKKRRSLGSQTIVRPLTASRLVPDLGDGLCDHVHVRLRVDAARDGEPNELESRAPVLTRLRVSADAHVAALHGAHAAVQIELGGQRLGGVEVLVELRQECLGVERHAVAPDRHHDRHTTGLQLVCRPS